MDRCISRAVLWTFAVLVFVGVCLLFPAKAYGDITIYVGYPGGPYYEKMTFTDAQIEQMSGDTVYEYSAFDQIALRKGFAKGVQLYELFRAAGIDVDALWRFYFSTEDGYISDDGGYGTNAWYYDSLVATPRYYFRDMPSCVTWQYSPYGNGAMVEDAIDSDLAWESAEEVPTILAYESSFERVRYENDIDAIWDNSNLMNSSKKYRLMFGQRVPSDGGARYSAYEVRSITCIFPNTPSIEMDITQTEFQVGDEYTFTPSLDALDEEVIIKGVSDIKWQSSNPNVAVITRNSDGTVTLKIVGAGQFSITASYGNSAYNEFVVKRSWNGSGTGGGDGGGNGEGIGEQTGSGDSDKTSEGEETTDPNAAVDPTEEPEEKDDQEETEKSDKKTSDKNTITGKQLAGLEPIEVIITKEKKKIQEEVTSEQVVAKQEEIGGGGQEGIAEEGGALVINAYQAGVFEVTLLLFIVGIVIAIANYEKNKDRNVSVSRRRKG